jgi:hypothetical protein
MIEDGSDGQSRREAADTWTIRLPTSSTEPMMTAEKSHRFALTGRDPEGRNRTIILWREADLVEGRVVCNKMGDGARMACPPPKVVGKHRRTAPKDEFAMLSLCVVGDEVAT